MLAETAIGDRLEEERGMTIRLRRRIVPWFVDWLLSCCWLRV
jgi:hypothetical protein